MILLDIFFFFSRVLCPTLFFVQRFACLSATTFPLVLFRSPHSGFNNHVSPSPLQSGIPLNNFACIPGQTPPFSLYLRISSTGVPLLMNQTPSAPFPLGVFPRWLFRRAVFGLPFPPQSVFFILCSKPTVSTPSPRERPPFFFPPYVPGSSGEPPSIPPPVTRDYPASSGFPRLPYNTSFADLFPILSSDETSGFSPLNHALGACICGRVLKPDHFFWILPPLTI